MSEHQRNTGRIVLVAVACAVASWRDAPARADGAFPTSQSVLLPRDRPSEIVLGTTFGLVFTEDDGATWRYSCENAQTRMGRQYTMGPPPDDRIFTLSDLGIPVTADKACTWIVAGGDIVPTFPFDVFPDPSDPTRVFALALNSEDGLVSAFRSMDSGMNYTGPLFTSPTSGTVTGIEVAASAPRTIFVTLYEHPGVHPRLVKSDDGGSTWTTLDIEPGIGASIPFLVTVDPVDSQRITLRITSGAGDPQQFQGLAITTDGGTTWTTPLKVPGGSLSGYARLPGGRILAVGTVSAATDGGTGLPAAFRSDDGGQTFTTQMLTFHAAGLSQRDGTFYVATNDFLDGFALASSTDAGETWTPRLRFRDIAGTKDCVRKTCQDDCDYLAGVKLFPPEMCNPVKKTGCGCGLAAASDPRRSIAAGALLLLVAWLVTRRFKRARR